MIDPGYLAQVVRDPAVAHLNPHTWTFDLCTGDLTHESGYGVRLYGAHGRWYPRGPDGFLTNGRGRRVGYGTPSKAIEVLRSRNHIPRE